MRNRIRRDKSSTTFGRPQAATLAVAGLLGASWVAGSMQAVQKYDARTGVSPQAAVNAEAASRPAWDLPNLDHERVDYWVNRFTTSMRDEYGTWLSRSGRYTPMISQKLAERGMPQDLIYLTMIESGFNPNAYSPAHASGLWQFIAETGRRYGLRVEGGIDERNDPEKSTDAALDYLEMLHDRFGSWYLAAAAYNSGENRVARVMREETGSEKGDEYSYYKISHRLPKETRDYVPLMVAAARVAKEPHKYGFADVKIESPVAVEEVPIDPLTPLAAVAEAIGVEAKELRTLNAHIDGGRTPAGRRTMVRIPEGTRTAFLINWPEVRAKETYAVTDYKIRKGDSLLGIAKRHGVSVQQIKSENSLRGTTIVAGNTLRIPNGR